MQYDFGFMPHRREVVVVVGSPIATEKIPDPSREQLFAHQKVYLDALVALFDAHKEEYAPEGVLKFVE